MAKPTWSNVSPTSGSGSGTVSIGAGVHTGRLQRTGTVTVKAANAADAPVAVTQEAKAEFVTIGNISAPKDGGNLTVSGKTNSSKLKLTLGNGDIVALLPESYSAGGASTPNDTAIAGDPGATAEIDFSLTLEAAANPTTADRSQTLTVTAAGGQQASATITQSAGEPTLSVSPASVTIPADGTAVSVTVTSNTNWTVE
jgi:hypothetical protein